MRGTCPLSSCVCITFDFSKFFGGEIEPCGGGGGGGALCR